MNLELVELLLYLLPVLDLGKAPSGCSKETVHTSAECQQLRLKHHECNTRKGKKKTNFLPNELIQVNKISKLNFYISIDIKK